MKMKIPVYNCIIDENEEDASGIYAISFVDSPANEVDFVALKKTKMYNLAKMRKSKYLLA